MLFLFRITLENLLVRFLLAGEQIKSRLCHQSKNLDYGLGIPSHIICTERVKRLIKCNSEFSV